MPITQIEVDRLNEVQRSGKVHPYTCGGRYCDGDGVLVATPNGWYCPCCDYRQPFSLFETAAEAVSP